MVLVEGLIAGLGDFGNIKHRVLLCCLLLFFVQKWRGGGSKDISTLTLVSYDKIREIKI